MNVRINQSDCIGCGVCMQVCPKVFALDESEGKATLLQEGNQGTGHKRSAVKEAIESCPIGCINE